MPREFQAVPSLRSVLEGGEPQGDRKIMVYVSANIHRAMKQVALDEDRSTSSVYVEAARTFLEARGKPVDADTLSIEPPSASASSDLAEAIDRQGERIEELRTAIDGIQGAGPRGGRGPAGTKVAEAMKVVLEILKAAGAAGILGRDLDAAAFAAGSRSGAVETAKAVLRGAGLARCKRKRWYLDRV